MLSCRDSFESQDHFHRCHEKFPSVPKIIHARSAAFLCATRAQTRHRMMSLSSLCSIKLLTFQLLSALFGQLVVDLASYALLMIEPLPTFIRLV
jgi:hypothetical protein